MSTKDGLTTAVPREGESKKHVPHLCDRHRRCTRCLQAIPRIHKLYCNRDEYGEMIILCEACFLMLSRRLGLSKEEMCRKRNDTDTPQEYTKLDYRLK